MFEHMNGKMSVLLIEMTVTCVCIQRNHIKFLFI
jgi:hypothetical protein